MGQYLQSQGWVYRPAPATDLSTNWYFVAPKWAQEKSLRGAVLGQDYFKDMVGALGSSFFSFIYCGYTHQSIHSSITSITSEDY